MSARQYLAAMALLTAPAWAGKSVNIASVAPEYTPTAGSQVPEPVSLHRFTFEIEPATGGARLLIDYTYPQHAAFGKDGGSRPQATLAELPGLRYDAAAKTVI